MSSQISQLLGWLEYAKPYVIHHCYISPPSWCDSNVNIYTFRLVVIAILMDNKLTSSQARNSSLPRVIHTNFGVRPTRLAKNEFIFRETSSCDLAQVQPNCVEFLRQGAPTAGHTNNSAASSVVGRQVAKSPSRRSRKWKQMVANIFWTAHLYFHHKHSFDCRVHSGKDEHMRGRWTPLRCIVRQGGKNLAHISV